MRDAPRIAFLQSRSRQQHQVIEELRVQQIEVVDVDLVVVPLVVIDRRLVSICPSIAGWCSVMSLTFPSAEYENDICLSMLNSVVMRRSRSNFTSCEPSYDRNTTVKTCPLASLYLINATRPASS